MLVNHNRKFSLKQERGKWGKALAQFGLDWVGTGKSVSQEFLTGKASKRKPHYKRKNYKSS